MANPLPGGQILALGLMAGLGTVAINPAAVGQDAANLPSTDGAETMAQPGNPVLPFTDVPPDHWAYQALLNLAGTYGCVSGYPDGTFQGEAAVSRYEFAAGLDSCLGMLMRLTEQQAAQRQELDALMNSLEQSFEELHQLDEDMND